VLGDAPPLVLAGQGLETLALAIDGRTLGAREYGIEDDALEIPAPPERFTLESLVRIHPERNTALSGLYRSSGNFCTQCEAHGFRRITWFLDRPDVMARYAVRIEADRERYPVLLSNGNRSRRRRSRAAGTRCAGAIRRRSPRTCSRSSRATCPVTRARSPRAPGARCGSRSGSSRRTPTAASTRCARSQRAMHWDEQVFGLEYELDVYMIVAVGDFNMGAMENKGLNIFNAKYVLAAPETATDDEYEAIEA
jgi:aminopeptidase N